MIELSPQKLIKLRTAKGFSQQQVADLVGVSQRSYSMWERGETKPKTNSVIKLLEVLEVSEARADTIKWESIPLIPIDAIAGFANGESQMNQKEIVDNYVVPEFSEKGVRYLIRVSGSSMVPKYSNGDLLGCKPIKDMSFFQWGKPYVLDTDQGALVKRLYPVADNEDILECRSDNSEMYPPFKIHKSSIYRIAIVVGVIRQE